MSRTRPRLRWPVMVGWSWPGRPGRSREPRPSEPGTGEGSRPAWAGFGLAAAVLALLVSVSLLLPTGVVAVEAPYDPQPVQVGQDYLYRLTVVNEGRVPVWLKGVRLDVAAPLWLVTSQEGTFAGAPAVAAGRRQVQAPVGALLWPGSQRTVALRIRALEPGEVTVRQVQLELVQLLDPRTLTLSTPPLAWVADAPAEAEPVFAEQARFGRSTEGQGYRLLRIEAADEGDVSRLVFVFRAPRGGEAEPPGFVASRTADGVELVFSGVQMPAKLDVPSRPAGLKQLATGRTPDGDARVRVGIEGLMEYRAYGRSQPPRVVLEWRSAAAGAVTYEVRVPAEHAALAAAVMEALEHVSPPVEPLERPGLQGGVWKARFDRRYAAERLLRALTAAGAPAQLQVVRSKAAPR